MKFIRIIIALLGIYLFVGVMSFLVIFFVWISRFTPDIPTNTVAVVNTEMQGNTRIQYSEVVSATTINSMFARNHSIESIPKATYSAESPVLFAQYEQIILHEAYVPLGFTTISRLISITDANGNKVYQYRNDFVDSIMSSLTLYFGEQKLETISLLARPDATSYTVSISTEGITYHEN